MRCVIDWPAVQQFHDEGNDRRACCVEFGFTMGAWHRAQYRGRLIQRACHIRRYDWAAVQAYYDEGHSYGECMERFGFCKASWTKSVRAGRLAPRPARKPLHVILNSRSRRTIKVRLLEAGILKNVCDECGISEWRGKRICIQIDHINGVPDDHRLENLRMLCPNCHSQTETYAAKNILRKKRTHLALIPGSLTG